MTDRVHALTVVLDKDYRDDDVQAVVQAIQMVKGVASVETHVTDLEDHYARERVRIEIAEAIGTAVNAVLHGKKLKVVEKE